MPATNRPDAEQRQAAIMFADIMGSSALADSLSLSEYDALVQEFGATSKQVLHGVMEACGLAAGELEHAIAGDEFHAFILAESPKGIHVHKVVKVALELAVRLKIRWLCSGTNRSRASAGKAPTGIGVGIHLGPVMTHWDDGGRAKCEGHAINLCKRIEGCSRQGQSRAFFYPRLHGTRCAPTRTQACVCKKSKPTR